MLSFISLAYDGHNLLKIHARDQYAYARTLLDVLFSKEEQKNCLLYKSAQSSKPPSTRTKFTSSSVSTSAYVNSTQGEPRRKRVKTKGNYVVSMRELSMVRRLG